MIALAAERPLAGGFTRRGACPALSAPMKTGDGLLVRLNPVAGGLTPEALIGLCEAAEIHGNGLIEVTARGSIQVRGLTESSAALFAQAIDALVIPVRTGVPVQTSVLAGLDPDEIADPTKLAEEIRAEIAAAGLEGRLGPKVSVVIDGGGRTALEDVSADVRLTATGDGWVVAIAGSAATARPLGVASEDRAGDAVVALLASIADLGRPGRARDLSDATLLNAVKGLEVLRSTAPPPGLPAPSRGEIGRSKAARSPQVSTTGTIIAKYEVTTSAIGEDGRDEPISPLEGEMSGKTEGGAKEREVACSLIGKNELRANRFALGIALPFGNTTANTLKTFAETTARLRITDIRPAPKRSLVAICETAAQAQTLRKSAEMLAFITSPDDPRHSISACPGSPDCASGHLPARKIVAEIASKYSGLLDCSIHLHVSGCAKGCAHPAASDLTIVGAERTIGLVVDGTARDEAAAFADNDAAGRAFANVASILAAEQHPDETTAQTIKRIGLSRLAEAFGRRRT